MSVEEVKRILERISTPRDDKFELNEISSDPVDVEWFHQKDSEWFGEFIIDGHPYMMSFVREDKTRNIPFKTVSFKFAKTKAEDPFAFSFDFVKPLVIQNTVIKAIKDYMLSERIEVFVVKAYSNETSRVTRYRKFVYSLKREFGFSLQEEMTHGKYTYFALFRNRSSWESKDKIIQELI